MLPCHHPANPALQKLLLMAHLNICLPLCSHAQLPQSSHRAHTGSSWLSASQHMGRRWTCLGACCACIHFMLAHQLLDRLLYHVWEMLLNINHI